MDDVLIDVLGFVLVDALVFVLVDELGFARIDALVVVLVQVLGYVLVEALVCVPIKQNFWPHVNKSLNEISCINLWKLAIKCGDWH